MEIQASIADIVTTASKLTSRELESLVSKLNLLRAQRMTPTLSKKETELLNKINEGFSQIKWKRLSELDDKMEFSDLTEQEAQESLSLAEELEAYTVQRFENLKKLAILREISVDELMHNLGITPQ